MLSVEAAGPALPRGPRWRPWRWFRGKGSGAFDLLSVGAVLTLAGLGVLNLYAVGGRSLALHQLQTVVVGLVLFAVFWTIGPRVLPVVGWTSYATAVLCLVAVPFVGVLAFGARRWLTLGSLTFQPSELAKLGLLLVLSMVLTWSRPAWQRFLLAMAVAAVPITLTVLEPDLSTASLLVALTLAMLVLGRVPMRFLVPLVGAAALAAPLAVTLVRPYQLERLHAFTSGSQSRFGSGWAVHQAHIALASGGLFGRVRDPMHGLLAAYLPNRETDFALASLVEQWGLVAGALAVLAAATLVWRLAVASRVPRVPAGGLVCGGLAFLIGIETLVSMGGNLGLLPVAGVPFPILSYGGTAVVAHLAALGIALGARREGAKLRLSTMPRPQSARPRVVRLAAVSLVGLLVAFTGYGWHLQHSDGATLRALGQQQMTRCFSLPAPRGMITDRHGTPLAVDVGTDRVIATPALVRDDARSLERLSALSGRPVSRLHARLTAAPADALTATVMRLPKVKARRVAAAKLPGVFVVPVPRRIYPTGSLLGPILGFVGVATPSELARTPGLLASDYVGRAGIEQQYDAILRGKDGEQCLYVDPPGVPVALGSYTPPVPGANLRLTLDLGLQRTLTAKLEAALGAEAGSRRAVAGAVAMNPKNGQVLAMASVPSYNNNLFGPPINNAALQRALHAPGSPMLEHATQSVGPPGSTFKLVVASADMRHQVLNPALIIPTGASYTLYGHTFHNWSNLWPMNLVQAIAWSNDVYFYKLAWALGSHQVIRTARMLGVGQPTGIDLPGENAGYLGTPRSVPKIGGTWYAGSTVLLGIGQGYLDVTPLQDARWTAAVSTGSLVTPRLGLAAVTAHGRYAKLPSAAPRRLPFAGKLGPVRNGMRAAVTGGLATILSGLNDVGAKTGTAQDPSAPGRTDDWMTAAAPMSNPHIVVTAMVQGTGEGAVTAGPVAEQALAYYFHHRAAITATARHRIP